MPKLRLRPFWYLVILAFFALSFFYWFLDAALAQDFTDNFTSSNSLGNYSVFENNGNIAFDSGLRLKK